MNDTEKAARRVFEWSFRFGIPALAWATVFAFFAFAGSEPIPEPAPAMDEQAAVPLRGDGTAAGPIPGLEQSRTREFESVEPAVAVVESHQPADAGRFAKR